MKLYLSSYRVPAPDELFKLVGKNPADIKAALIPNAKDYYAERAKHKKVQGVAEYLQNLQLQTEIVDLRDYDNPDDVRSTLESFDLLWLMGGNTFCLRYEIRRSGLEKVINDLLNQGVVFAGESAGAIVAGTSLYGVEGADDPDFAEETIVEGLNLVPYFILPHADDPNFEDCAQVARTVHPDTKTRLELTNAQAAIFDNETMRVVY
jgi:dipeptidase E